MVVSQCGVCHVRDGVHRCIQCHKPVCDECAFKTTGGVFCGRKCASAYRDFLSAKRPEPKKKSRVGMILLAVVLIILVAAAAYYFGMRAGAH